MTPDTAFKYASVVYEALEKDAEGGVWRGSKVKLFRETNLSRAYYTPLFNLLTELGCIEQTHTGGGAAPTVIRLISKPESVEQVEAVYETSRLTRTHTLDSLRADLDELRRRVPEIDLSRWIVRAEERFANIEGRLSAMEGRADGETEGSSSGT